MTNYTDEQVAMLERAQNGMLWEWNVDEEYDDILRFLMDRPACIQARADIHPDLLVLTERGKSELQTCRSVRNQAEEEAKEKAEAKRQQRFQNKLAITQALVPAVTFVIGLLVEHFAGLVQWFVSLFH